MTFGESLISIRKQKGISRKDFAAQLEIPYTTLRNYETDQREPGHHLLIRMAMALDVSVDELVGRNNPAQRKESVSPAAMALAKDYDDLDPHGQKIVRAVTDEEKKRMEAENAGKSRRYIVKKSRPLPGGMTEEDFSRYMATLFAARDGGLQSSNITRARHLKALEEDIRKKKERGELD